MRFLALLILLLSVNFGLAQDPVIQLKAGITDAGSGKRLGGVTIEVLQDGRSFVSKTSASNGKFPLIDLPVGHVYMVKIKKAGYVTKMAKIDARNDFPEDLPVFYTQPFETELFESVDGVDFSFLEREPMIEFAWDSQGELIWDKPKLKVMQKKIQDLKDELARKKAEEELANKKAEQLEKDIKAYVAAGDAAFAKGEFEKAMSQYKAALDLKADPGVQSKYDDSKTKWEEEKNAAELQKRLSEKMAAAKKEFDAKNYEQALALYKEALKIKPDETLAQQRIDEINKILEDQKNAKANFDKLVAEGDKAMGSELYDDAITKYTEALKLIDDAAVQKKLADAKAKKAEKEAAEKESAAKKAAYDKLIADADKLFDTKKYAEAKAKYEEATGMFPAEQHPKDRIAEIDKLLKEMEAEAAAKQKLEDDYKALIAEADKMFEGRDWDGAETKYKAALDLKPGEQWPTDQLDKINAARSAAKAEAEKQAAYDAAIKEADILFNQQKYEEAKGKYQEASGIMPQEQKPKDKIAEINKLIADAAAAEELEAKYKKLMEEGDGLMGIKDYTAAIDRFKKALEVKPGDNDATNKINECERLSKEQADADAKQREFEALVKKGDELFNSKNYSDAKFTYEKAVTIIEDEGVRNKIKECDEMVKALADAAALREKYDKVIKEADDLYKAHDYEAAIGKYQQGLDLISTESYPKEQISLCKSRLEDLASAEAKEQQFNDLIAKADKAYADENYGEALDKYKEAILVKPDPAISKKIDEIQVKIAQQDQNAAIEKRYQAKIDEADAAFTNKDWETSRALYTEAINIIDRDYPRNKIKEIEENMKAETEQEIERQYQKIITKADGLRDQKEYDQAISYYERAKTIKKGDPYPQEQIDAIRKARADAADAEAEAKRIEEGYNAAIKKADEAYNAKNWSAALENYHKALGFKPDEQHPKDRIKEIEAKVGDLEAAKLKDAEYEKYVKMGDDAMGSSDWKTAIKHYQEALEVYPDKQYPKDQIIKAEDMMKAESENEIEAQYQKLLTVAKKKFDEKNYKMALDYYIRAQKLKPEDPLPQRKIDEINQILADLANEKANSAAYDKLIKQADGLFHNSKWKEAKAIYEQAAALIPKKYAKDQINACIAHMREDSQAEVLAQYNKIIKKADELFNGQQYKKSQDLYKRALNLKPTDQYPKDQLAKIDKILNPKKYLAESNGMPYYGEPNRNTDAIDVQQMLLDAELQRDWISNKRAQKQGEDHDAFIAAQTVHQENHNFETKEEVEKLDTDMELAEWTAEVKRTESIAVIESENQLVQETWTDWARTNENVIQQQKQMANQFELDLERENSENQIARIEFLGDVEEVHLQVKEEKRRTALGQEDENYDTKDAANHLAETYIVNDPNNDIDRKNNEVYVEDYQVTLINKSKLDVWGQEDETQKTIQERDLLVDEIFANRINDDITRIENVDNIEDINLEYIDASHGRSTEQYDANIDGKLYTEKLKDEIDLANMNNDIPRQKMELTTERKELEVSDNIGNMTANQNDVLMNSDEYMDNLEVKIEEYNSEMDKDREGFEETVEDVNLKIKDERNQYANSQDKERNNAVDEVEDINQKQRDFTDEANRKNDEATDEAGEFVEDMINQNQDLRDKADDDLEKAGNYVELLKDINPNEITERSRNKLGQEFPEGMTETIYTRNDENGLPVAYIIRRVVVRDGVGDFYEKVQTRSGISYTMNGKAITEFMWQDHTMAADLVRN